MRAFSELLRPRPPHVGRAAAYATSLAATIVACGLELLLRPAIYSVPYMFFFPAIVVAAWVGGARPGFAAAALSSVLVNVLLVVPHGAEPTGTVLLTTVLFALVSSIIIVLTSSLRQRDLELERAVRLRDEFVTIASHELKTPLTPLTIKLQSLSRALAAGDGPSFDARLRADLEVMQRQVGRLTALVDELLDVSRISAGRMELRPEVVELGELVSEVVARFQPEAKRAGSALSFERTGTATATLDRLRLEQVLVSLLSNAIKYGASKPILVTVGSDGTAARIVVRDEGIGIEPEVLPRIFGKFERGVSDRNYGGLGLGLYMARQIIEAMGGTVSVESERGAGATFTVRVPLSALARR